MATVAEILAAAKAALPEEPVECPEWGATLTVRAITKAQQREMRKAATDRRGQVDTDAMEREMFCRSVVEPAFTPADFDVLVQGPAAPVERVLQAVLRLNGLDGKAVASAEAAFQAES